MVVVKGAGWGVVEYFEEGIVEGNVDILSFGTVGEVLPFEDDSIAGVALLNSFRQAFLGSVGNFDGAEGAGILQEGALYGVGVAAEPEGLGDLMETAKVDDAGYGTGCLVNLAVDEKLVEFVGELSGRSKLGVGRDFPIEIDLAALGVAAEEPNFSSSGFGELMNG